MPTVNSLNKPVFTSAIYTSYKKYPDIERKKLLNLQKKIHEDWIKTAGAVPDGETKKIEIKTYYPLELE